MNPARRKALAETFKSLGRGLWFAILGLVVAALTALATSGQITDMGVTIAGFTVNLSVIILAVVAYVVKLLDTYIHNNQNINSNGLAPSFLQNSATPVSPAANYPVAPGSPAPGTIVAPSQPAAPVNPTPAPTQTQIPVTDANAVQNPVTPDPSQLNS